MDDFPRSPPGPSPTDMVPRLSTVADAVLSLRRNARDLLELAVKEGDEIHRDLANLIISVIDSKELG